MDQDGEVPNVLSAPAMSAAINFVKVACQQAAYMVGQMEKELHKFQSCKCTYMVLNCFHILNGGLISNTHRLAHCHLSKEWTKLEKPEGAL